MAEESVSSKLDNMGKEELIKLVKKYMILQKQLKIKNEDLNKKIMNTEDNTGLFILKDEKIKDLEKNIDELKVSNDKLTSDNCQEKLNIENLTKQIELLQEKVIEYEKFKIEVEPQLENAQKEIDLNKSMLDILNNEVQMLNSDKVMLEKRLFSTRRNVTPSIIVEEDEEDLEEEKRNDQIHYNNEQTIDYASYEEDNCECIEKNNHDIDLLLKVPSNNDGIIILNKQIEDLTFYVDELKSELEVEREQNKEYIADIKNYQTQIEDFEQQHEFSSLESSTEKKRIQQSLDEALENINNKNKLINELKSKIVLLTSDDKSGLSEHLDQADQFDEFIEIFLSEIIAKKNFDGFEEHKEKFTKNIQKITLLVTDLKNLMKKQEDRVTAEMVKSFEANKNFEKQMERVIRDFRQEINSKEMQLNDKQIELNEFKQKRESEMKDFEAQLKFEKEMSRNSHKEISKNKMLDLEIADYEKSIKSLNSQIQNKDKLITESKAQLKDAQQSLAKLKIDHEETVKEKDSFDEKCSTMKQLLIKAKKEIADAKEHEAHHLNNDAHLKKQIELSNIEVENYKISFTNSSVEIQQLQEKLKLSNEFFECERVNLETKLKTKEDSSKNINSQLVKLKKEYESYKIKVQHAFKKQKNELESSNTTVTEIEEKNNFLKEINELKDSNEILSNDLIKITNKSCILENELETVQEDLTKALKRNTSLLNQLKEKEDEWKLQSQTILKERIGKFDESEEIIRNLKLEIEAISLNSKEKLKALKSQNSQSISLFQNQIIESKQEISSLHIQIKDLKEKKIELEINAKNLPLDINVSNKESSPQLRRINSQNSIDLTNNFILRQVENIDQSFENKSYSNKSVEELLNESPVYPNNTMSDSKDLLHQMEILKQDMKKGKLQLIHLNELLNESELNNSRLTEQINVLKDEIRRLERNQERDKSISNMEYLKNVVYKFLTFTNHEEKTQLLPVLTTMLKLSPDEQTAIMSTRVVSSVYTESDTGGGGWTSYLAKWT